MFIPFLAASMLAAAFTHMGAMSVRIAMLTGALNTLLVLVLVAVIYTVWQSRKA